MFRIGDIIKVTDDYVKSNKSLTLLNTTTFTITSVGDTGYGLCYGFLGTQSQNEPNWLNLDRYGKKIGFDPTIFVKPKNFKIK